MKKFKIKTYTGTVHTKRPVFKLNQILRFVPKHTEVHIRLIVDPDSKSVSEIQDLIISPVQYLDFRSLSNYVVDCITPNFDDSGDYLTIFVYDEFYDLPF